MKKSPMFDTLQCMPVKEAVKIAHTLSKTSKMPGPSYSLPISACHVGSRARNKEGTVCQICYASRGLYRIKPVREAMAKRLEGTKHRLWPDAMASMIWAEEWFRWFDSGDLQGMKMLLQIVEIANNLPQTKFWLPTKEKSLVLRYLKEHPEGFPDNLVVRVSHMMVDPSKIMETNGLFNTSSSHERKDPVGFLCTAESRGEKCGYCRACWDKSITNITYPVRKPKRNLIVNLEAEEKL